MTARAKQLLEQARTLGRDELAELVDRLVQELDDREAPHLSAADIAELDARSAAVANGEYSEYKDAESFMDALRARTADSIQPKS